MLFADLNGSFQKMFRRPECPNHANGGGHAQQVHGDKSCLGGQTTIICITFWQSVAVFFLCPPILSEAELQWGEEKRPLRVAWRSGRDVAGTESREMNV